MKKRTMNRNRAAAVILGAMAVGTTGAVAGMGQCGAGKCGGNMKKGENSEMNQNVKGQCGAKMGEEAQKRAMKGKCGAKMKQQESKKPMKGQCGAGKCGGSMK